MDDDGAPLSDGPTRFSPQAQAFHWAIAVLVLAAFLVSPDGERTPALQRQWHETIGFAVLLLSVARLVWRLGDPQPQAPRTVRWFDAVATTVQVLLVVLLFAVPLTAIAGSWLDGDPLIFLGGLRISPWIEPDRALGHTISDVHGWLGNAILWLAGVHAAAALVHHWVLRDGVLASMLPRWPRGG